MHRAIHSPIQNQDRHQKYDTGDIYKLRSAKVTTGKSIPVNSTAFMDRALEMILKNIINAN